MTTTNTGSLLRGYAAFVENFVRRKIDLENIEARIEMDEVREMHNEMWTLVDNYGGGGE